MSLPGGPVPVDAARRWVGDATSRLLGETIGMSDAELREPSLLPGWSRAHVVTHIARGADRLRHVATNPEAGLGSPTDADERFEALERGADRPGIELQLDLDTSASDMHRSWNEVADWETPIQIFDKPCSLAMLPIIRLHEVCIHHLDLRTTGCDPDSIDPDASIWLLRWVLSKMVYPAGRAMTVTATSGTTATIGSGRVSRNVSGTDAHLWAWLSGRADATFVDGARGLAFDPLA